jgi:hypothetical protein
LVLYQRAFLLCALFFTPFWAVSQVAISADSTLSATLPTDSTTGISVDSSLLYSLPTDSIDFDVSNHISDLSDNVEYEADDSIILDLPNKKAYLYGNAKIFYQDILTKKMYLQLA